MKLNRCYRYALIAAMVLTIPDIVHAAKSYTDKQLQNFAACNGYLDEGVVRGIDLEQLLPKDSFAFLTDKGLFVAHENIEKELKSKCEGINSIDACLNKLGKESAEYVKLKIQQNNDAKQLDEKNFIVATQLMCSKAALSK